MNLSSLTDEIRHNLELGVLKYHPEEAEPVDKKGLTNELSLVKQNKTKQKHKIK